MINIDVFSEEKAWSKKIRKKEFFFNKICKAFPKKYKFSSQVLFSLTRTLTSYLKGRCLECLGTRKIMVYVTYFIT